MPLLGRKEKGELEEMILERLVAHWNANGADALVAEGVCVVLDARGPRIDVAHGEELASVEIRTPVCASSLAVTQLQPSSAHFELR